MAAGYVFGTLYQGSAARRSKLLWRCGTLLLAGFVILRATNVYGDPRPWSPQPDWTLTLLSFLNPTRFPSSLQCLLLTLGPALMLLAALEGNAAPLDRLAVFGRVPLCFYVTQLLVVHTIALGVTVASGRDAAYLFVTEPFSERPPPGAGFGLPVVYACWAAAIGVLYALFRRTERSDRSDRSERS